MAAPVFVAAAAPVPVGPLPPELPVAELEGAALDEEPPELDMGTSLAFFMPQATDRQAV